MAAINAKSKLGDAFVAFGLATRKQVKDALGELKPTEMLGQVLVRKGICDAKLCDEVADVLKRYRSNVDKLKKSGLEVVLDNNTSVGDILMALGLITYEAKEKAASDQQELVAQGKDPGRLLAFLVARGDIHAEDRLLVIKVQNWLRGAR